MRWEEDIKCSICCSYRYVEAEYNIHLRYFNHIKKYKYVKKWSNH